MDAGLALLSEQGFGEFGVNPAARVADCDKKLIHPYFDGQDRLTRAAWRQFKVLDLTAPPDATGALAPLQAWRFTPFSS